MTTPIATWQWDEMRLKVYGITHHHSPRAGGAASLGWTRAIMLAAKAAVGDAAPWKHDARHHGLGFSIIHEGEWGWWLLIDWWTRGDVLCQHSLHGTDIEDLSPVTEHFMASVWEAPVISHECEAWTQFMITHRPSPGRYLASWLLPDDNDRGGWTRR